MLSSCQCDRIPCGYLPDFTAVRSCKAAPNSPPHGSAQDHFLELVPDRKLAELAGMRRIGVLQAVKQRFARRVLRAIRQRKRKAQPELWREDENQWAHIWQARFYDFNVWTRRKQVEKCVTCMRIQSSGAWCWSPDSGRGAVSGITRKIIPDR